MKKLLIITAIISMLTGCVNSNITTAQRTEINFNGMQPNNLVSKYMERPTFAKLHSSKEGGNTNLAVIYLDSYGDGYISVRFDKPNAQQHIDAIDKYLKWEKIALERGDLISKNIASIPVTYTDLTNLYDIYSPNSTSALLSIETTTAEWLKGIVPMYFNHDGAIKLKAFLIELRDGKLTMTDNTSVYQ